MIMKKDKEAVIFGTGEIGILAYHYYKEKVKISCFVDNSEEKQNTVIFGINVEKPSVLKDIKDILVIVPRGKYTDEMCDQIKGYGIEDVIIFGVDDRIRLLGDAEIEKNVQSEIIINYKGGLGNQLFQYAFSRYMRLKGKKVTADISSYHYPGMREFELRNVFESIDYIRCNSGLREQYLYNNDIYVEPDVSESFGSANKEEANNMEYGYCDGYFQSFSYIKEVEEELRSDLVFRKINDKGYDYYRSIIGECNAVAVHIRRGDYLTRSNERIFGGICTDEYYRSGIEYIKKVVDNPVFIFFSNDIEYVKDKFGFCDGIYLEQSRFEGYEDWYDLQLMALCKHQIIANSSFSWWGAWLNSNKDKIVIAPSQWINYDSLVDICPNDWVKM